jgi:hypothetical protein
VTRALLIETASPKRVRRKAERMLADGDTGLTILCGDEPGAAQSYREMGDVEIIGLPPRKRSLTARALRERNFDAIHVFWTGEEKYRRMKWYALHLGMGRMVVDAGDGNIFRLTWKAIPRFWLFRRKHPLPSDHYEFVPQPAPQPPPRPAPPQAAEPVPPHASPRTTQKAPEAFSGQKILVLQSAEPPQVLRALDRLRERPLFVKPHYILLCRNRPEILKSFQGHSMLAEIRTHHETRDSWKLLRALRRERLEVAVLFLTGDPSYWKLKCFAFLLGARHKLIFNENNDCFYFHWRPWLSLLSCRLQNRPGLRVRQPWTSKVRPACLILIKLLVLPFRFAWLLLVWLRLRASALRTSQ